MGTLHINIENLAPSAKHGGRGIMVWGCLSGGVRVKTYSSDFNGKYYAFQDPAKNGLVHSPTSVHQHYFEIILFW